MKKASRIINGAATIFLSLVGIALIATQQFVDAAAAAKTKPAAQPQIASFSIKYSGGEKRPAKTVVWPREAGKVIALAGDVTGVQLTPSVQRGFKQKTYWALRYVWSDEQPQIARMMSEAKTIAGKHFSAKNFTTRVASPTFAIDADEQGGRFLTIYAFATNKDRVTAAKNFPLGIDYVAAVTFRVPDADADDNIAAEKAVKEPSNDDWSQLEATLPGYKE